MEEHDFPCSTSTSTSSSSGPSATTPDSLTTNTSLTSTAVNNMVDAAGQQHSTAVTETLPALRRRPVPSKGHTKSRRGCLNCKSRRVKCPETFPECGHCVRLGLRCQYPRPSHALAAASDTNNAAMTLGSPSTALTTTPASFDMLDLRFFHHFLLTAYPALPIDGERVWKEVACLSHSFDFLIHAMLGLGASHLQLATSSDTDYTSQALSHRVKAISCLNRSLANPCASKAEGDARFATLLALTFQASYMGDAMLEFVSMIRGCTVIPQSAMTNFRDSVFKDFTTAAHQQLVVRMNNEHGLDGSQLYPTVRWYQDFIEEGNESLRALGPLCRSGFEVIFYGTVLAVLEKAKSSPMEGFVHLCYAYQSMEDISSEDFRHFVDESNIPAHILLAHFFLIEHEIAALALRPVIHTFHFRSNITSSWVREVARKAGPGYSAYMAWPLDYVSSGKMRAMADSSLQMQLQPPLHAGLVT